MRNRAAATTDFLGLGEAVATVARPAVLAAPVSQGSAAAKTRRRQPTEPGSVGKRKSSNSSRLPLNRSRQIIQALRPLLGAVPPPLSVSARMMPSRADARDGAIS